MILHTWCTWCFVLDILVGVLYVLLGVLGILVGVLCVLFGVLGILFGILGVFFGVLGVFILRINFPKSSPFHVLCGKKVRRLEKGTPPSVGAVVTIMRYGDARWTDAGR